VAEQQIKFTDGAAYERMMGIWSRMAGDIFLDWVKPAAGLRWIDIGCGNGAFTENIVERCAPAEVQGIDPSDGQLAYARTRPASRLATFQQGDAMALPFAANTFDAAVMALVLFFVPEPAKGVAEMARVVKPGGAIAAYAWDMLGGGFPMEPIQAEMRAMGMNPMLPPSVDASRIDAMRGLWAAAGLEGVETRVINVVRTYADFDELWTTSLAGAAALADKVDAMPQADRETLKGRVRARLPADASGRITYGAFANAVKGRVPS
jgi:ubiquinone/menaquinone biosynthesis C-methylase UbiE